MANPIDPSRLRADLERLVRIPSIAFPAFDQAPVAQAAQETASILEDAGLAGVSLLDVPGGPDAVYGELAPPGGWGSAPTVLLYAHYDVQPANELAAWDSDPWSPEERGGRLYGRGTADDKNGIAMHAALLRAFGGRPPVGVKVVIEGEEETGRGTFDAFVAAEPERFASDLIVVADGGNWKVGEPTLTTSLRGLTVVDVEVSVLRQPVHSGQFGGAVPDAGVALFRMLATLHDEAGDVAVEGLVREPWDGLAADEDQVRGAGGMLDGVAFVGTGPLAERLYCRPAITAIGLDVPGVEQATNSLHARMKARLSARLAPSQDPDDAAERIVAHLRAAAPAGVHLDFSVGAQASGYRLRGGGPGSAAAQAALQDAYGKAAVEVGSGGAIPLVTTLANALPQAEIVLWGACDDGAQIHSANESVDLAELHRAAEAQVRLLERLAAGT